MADSKAPITVDCPCCSARLLVDSKTGLVLKSREKRSSDYSFESALEREKQRKDQSDDMFAQAFKDERKRRESLEDKFRAALDSKDELEDPIRPIDLD